jgi:hypothetical protein
MTIPVIYILSNGRSGSTLLDLLLGTHPAIWTLGEAQILPWELKEDRLPCGCGKKLTICEFWQPILTQIPLDEADYPIEYFREKHRAGRAIRWAHLYDIIRHQPSVRRRAGIAAYGAINARYFSAVKSAAERQMKRPMSWLVDASKDIYRLFWLQQSDHFDLRIIHLTKDPRAFVYSMTRASPYDTRQKRLRFTGRWIFENALQSRLCTDPALSKSVYRLQYEELAKRPGKTMASLGKWLGVDPTGFATEEFRQQENHAIAGNLMRWRAGEIRLDGKWQRGLPTTHQNAIWALSGALARKYDYHR